MWRVFLWRGCLPAECEFCVVVAANLLLIIILIIFMISITWNWRGRFPVHTHTSKICIFCQTYTKLFFFSFPNFLNGFNKIYRPTFCSVSFCFFALSHFLWPSWSNTKLSISLVSWKWNSSVIPDESAVSRPHCAHTHTHTHGRDPLRRRLPYRTVWMREKRGRRGKAREREREREIERERRGGALIYTAPKRMNTKLKCMTVITK